jgi:hypothetical protein
MKEAKIPIYYIKKLPRGFSFSDGMNIQLWESINYMKLVDNLTGNEPRQNTWVKFGWTDSHLWAYFNCKDSHIKATIIEHDNKNIWTENVVEIFLDPLGLKHIYYELLVNCQNTGFDGIVHLASGKKGIGSGKGIQCFTDWNPCSFIHRVTGRGIFNNSSKSDEFWEVVLCISFEEFYINNQKTPEPGDHWYFNIFRVDSGPWGRELYSWNATLIPDFHVSENFGIMEFIC